MSHCTLIHRLGIYGIQPENVLWGGGLKKRKDGIMKY